MGHLHFAVILTLVSLLAFSRGGAPERLAMLLIVLGVIATALVTPLDADRFLRIETALFIVDAAVLALFVALALVANRFWPLWLSGMQALAVIAHLIAPTSAQVIAWTYYAIISYWIYPMLALMVAATLRHRLRLRAYSADPSWSGSLIHSPREKAPTLRSG